MNPRATAPVMTDVARLAGVSHQTVSRVINNSPNVSTPTREKVLAAMEELGYRRNAAARALVTRRSGTLGVITFDTALFGPVSTLYAVEQAAGRHGLGVSIAVVDSAGDGSVPRAMERLQDQAVEGVVVLAPQDDAVRAVVAGAHGLPVVFVGGVIGGGDAGPPPTVPVVGIDQFGGAVAAVGHLLGLGHRTVHHVAGPAGWLDARRRREGWRHALGGRQAPDAVAGDWSARSGHTAMRALLTLDPGLTAVFAANDQMALGALRALAEAGRRVPDDVSVVGFDDVPEAEFFAPPLTTVAQEFGEAGSRAVSTLLHLIRPEEGPAPDVGGALVPTRLLVRASTGSAPR